MEEKGVKKQKQRSLIFEQISFKFCEMYKNNYNSYHGKILTENYYKVYMLPYINQYFGESFKSA